MRATATTGVTGIRAEAPELARRRSMIAAAAASDKKGEATVVLDMADQLGVVDTFVITSGTNPRQVRTIADEVEARLKEVDGRGPLRVEGLDDARWVLLDFGDIVVHVFLDEVRAYYDLEHLWAGAPRLDWENEPVAG